MNERTEFTAEQRQGEWERGRMQFLHSASAMADTNMKKKNFARRRRRNYVAQIAVAKGHFSVAQNNISVAHFRADICFFARRQTFSVAQKVRRANHIFRRARWKISSRKIAPALNISRRNLNPSRKKSYPPFILAPKISNPSFLTRR